MFKDLNLSVYDSKELVTAIDLVVRVSGVSNERTVGIHLHVDKNEDVEITVEETKMSVSDTVVSTWTPSSTDNPNE